MAKNPNASLHALANVREIVMRDAGARLKTSNFYVQEEVFSRGAKVPIPRQAVAVDRPTVMAFVDDSPLMNWAHPCRYLLHDAETGELYRQIAAHFPPYAGERDTPSVRNAVIPPHAAQTASVRGTVAPSTPERSTRSSSRPGPDGTAGGSARLRALSTSTTPRPSSSPARAPTSSVQPGTQEIGQVESMAAEPVGMRGVSVGADESLRSSHEHVSHLDDVGLDTSG